MPKLSKSRGIKHTFKPLIFITLHFFYFAFIEEMMRFCSTVNSKSIMSFAVIKRRNAIKKLRFFDHHSKIYALLVF